MTVYCACTWALPRCCLHEFEEEEVVQIIEENDLYPTLITSTKSHDAFKRHSGQRKDTLKSTGSHDDIEGDSGIIQVVSSHDQESCSKAVHFDNDLPSKDLAQGSQIPSFEAAKEFAAEAETCQHQLTALPPKKQGVLGRCVDVLQSAVTLDADDNVIAADRELLVQGFEAFAAVLDMMGNIGSHISANTKKLRSSKASNSESDYKRWLVSELPVHATNKYKDYADPSAGVANVWIGWTFDFFVEMFSNLHKGRETVPSINDAYKITLANHHNFVMRNAFTIGVRQQMPNRKKLYEILRGDTEPIDVAKEVQLFVQVCRPIVRYLLQLHEVMFKLFEVERKSLKR